MERRCRANNDGARMRIGFIGLGDQGGPMAQMILAGGFDLTVWARREAVRADYVRRGAKAATDPVALAAASDLLCLCVTGDEDVRALMLDQGLLEAMGKRSIVALHRSEVRRVGDECVRPVKSRWGQYN